MKQISKRISVIILTACILFSAGIAGFAANARKKNTPVATDWMRGIADTKRLYEINIPGTHDSAMANYRNSTGNYVRIFGIPVVNSGIYACTQTLTVKEQLEAGVRFFDLRFSPKSGELRLCHGDLDCSVVCVLFRSAAEGYRFARRLGFHHYAGAGIDGCR